MWNIHTYKELQEEMKNRDNDMALITETIKK
jgi:hypothetical protein